MNALAERIADDIRESRAFRLSGLNRLDLPQAYAVQDAVVDRLASDPRAHAIGGYKLAFNKQASFDYYGITEPCSAPVFANRILPSGSSLRLDSYRQLVIEPEIAAVLGEDLPTSAVTIEQAGNAISHYVAAFELLDVRGAFDFDPSAAEAVAQGVYNVGAVLGKTRLKPENLEISALPVSLILGGAEPMEARGAAPQDPVDAVCWLANHLGARGQGLKAGMIVLCGTHLPAQTIRQTGVLQLDMGPLGRVELALT
ncbi:fumarylacetoacetate hydrolase family protein [Tianweitania sp. BSSL-BM11]|uniref:Fumarylacetoacetate hydrolase family protein n=1 Tax=Tianweitania aestuarii TaxID=2814886 RepID=A0ABS5RV47_9HYPH|nr:fumarylacetoacetate hydrolase family protein [Tianweitania aestuarii]MBS9720847.1 fumarylacetoacetate hydrolase family protein [Tianweitania aestuarii]